MKVCYLTWGETPRSYGVFGSQVIGQFVATKTQMPDSEFYFISGVPLIHSGYIRETWKYRQELKKVKQKLEGIEYISIPIFSSQNFVNSSKSTFALMHFGAHAILFNTIKKIQPDIIHCRSYHAAWAALDVRTKYKLSYKIIFDARGLWPEEVSLKKKFSESSQDYRFLKNIESELLLNCDLVIGVSNTMVCHYKTLGAKNVKCIYLSADIDGLKTCKQSQDRKHIHFGYVGALSDDSWHKPSELLALYKNIRKVVKNAKIIIITTSNHEAIINKFSDIPSGEIVIKSTKTVDELKNALSDLDFGLMSYLKPSGDREILLADMVLAVKTAEYIAAGLPIIVNKMCGGASNIVNQYGLGIAYDPVSFEEITEKDIVKFVNDGRSTERSMIAKELFDYSSNALKYKELYEAVLVGKQIN